MWEVTFQVLLLAGIAWGIGVLHSVKNALVDVKLSVDDHTADLRRQIGNINETLEDKKKSSDDGMASGFSEETHPNLEILDSIAMRDHANPWNP